MTNTNLTHRDESLLGILQAALSKPTEGCVVNRWALDCGPEYVEMLEKVKEKKAGINITDLYRKLNSRSIEASGEELPFKATAFKSHLGEYCTCQ